MLKFTDDEKAVARQLLQVCPISRDQLPYTDDFDKLYERFRNVFTASSYGKNEFWRLLSSAGKQGGLAKERKPRIVSST